MAKIALFRCDASPKIGAGHVVRCSALADALRERGWNCRFVALPGTRAIFEMFGCDHDMSETPAADDPAALRALAPAGCDLLVVDSYRLDSRFGNALRGWAGRQLDIEDIPSRIDHDADFLLDQTLGRRPADYGRHIAPSTRLLLGPDYALLRPAFAAARPAALARRRSQTGIRRILVSLGGAAPAAILELALAAIARADIGATVDLVAGSTAYSTPASLSAVTVHRNVVTMAALMSECDLAIGAGGTSAMERCCLGLPTLLLRLADNQNDNARALAAAGVAIDLGPARALDAATLGAELTRLAEDPAAYAKLSHNGALVCDGLGARRSASAIAPRLASDGRPVQLRRATLADAELVFSWQCLPEVRRHAKTPRAPAWDEHSAWFAQRSTDTVNGPFSLIEHDDKPVGVLRFDAIDRVPGADSAAAGPETYLVSILINPVAQGKGIARAALACGRDLLPGGHFYAEILSANLPSQRLFAAAGYKPVGRELYLSNPTV
jgi:UDP-2,4-diacetamido-2,4,6-trideoxy-beta-L-altropyranose hydrolase